MLAHYLINPDMRHNMDVLSETYLNYTPVSITELIGKKGKNQGNMADVDPAQVVDYAAEDADITLQLHETLWDQLGDVPPLKKVYEEIEQPLVPVLLDMEETGVLVDRKMLQTQSGELAKKMAKLEAKAHELAGGPFNLGSPKQLQQILFEQQELPVIRKTPKGQPSTAEDVLAELASDYELPRVIIERASGSVSETCLSGESLS